MLEMIETAGAANRNADGMPPAPECEECQGEGGWLRYEPRCEPAIGLLHLSCLHCRGRGRLLPADA